MMVWPMKLAITGVLFFLGFLFSIPIFQAIDPWYDGNVPLKLLYAGIFCEVVAALAGIWFYL